MVALEKNPSLSKRRILEAVPKSITKHGAKYLTFAPTISAIKSDPTSLGLSTFIGRDVLTFPPKSMLKPGLNKRFKAFLRFKFTDGTTDE